MEFTRYSEDRGTDICIFLWQEYTNCQDTMSYIYDRSDEHINLHKQTPSLTGPFQAFFCILSR